MISVIIPTYNRSSIITKTLDSVRNQTLTEWECIVVDDFSTDGTKDLIEEYRKKEERIYYLVNERSKGAQGARNTGILHSKGEWVVFFDSDNIMHPNFLKRSYESLIEQSVDICGSFSRIIDYSTMEVVGRFDWIGYGRIHDDIMTGKSYFDNSSTLIKKSKVLEIGLLDEDCPSYQEWDTHIRLSKIATYTTIQEPLVDYYRGGVDTISASQEKDIKGLLFILNKFKREWLFHYPLVYLRKMYSIYSNLQLLQSSKQYEELSELYSQKTNMIMRLLVSFIFKYRKGSDYKGKAIAFFLAFAKMMVGGGIIESRKALKTKQPYYITPICKSEGKKYWYQMSFIAEFIQYFNARLVSIPHTKGNYKMFYSLDFGFFIINQNYEDYFSKSIKSPERALIRKAIKNGYTCKEINYDEYLGAIHNINVSKDTRQGEAMSSDYIGNLKPRQSLVSSIGQDVHTFGCFDKCGNLVAYYMFELYGLEIIHTVKGLGHSDHLKYGIMNYLFGYSVSELYKYYPDGKHIISYGGMTMYSGGLSRFKRNVGCKPGCMAIKGNKQFYKDLKHFNKIYKIHGDTGLNFILDYLN